MNTYEPMGSYVLLKKVVEETKQGSIILPTSGKEKTNRGTVVAVGPGRYKDDGTREAMTVGINECVVYTEYAATDVDDDHVIVKQDDILLSVVTN